ncbi:hypothetical protein OUZ56_019043 [Daphnia magna]|uniref:Uncharacterized protein n=1 Tax=Daphnia magna TaxID=35525 RepID=A0ABQ9ZAJ1_9CRUS|nr:hypothetical protein OUZ56_019043 [Daphnia magna]
MSGKKGEALASLTYAHTSHTLREEDGKKTQEQLLSYPRDPFTFLLMPSNCGDANRRHSDRERQAWDLVISNKIDTKRGRVE